jgi:hypothetical protein
MTALKLGAKLKSAVCDTQIMVIRTLPGDLDLRCGGVPMDSEVEGVSLDSEFADGSLIGKRYVDEAERIELLCTKGGAGSLSLGVAKLLIKQPKALPSSD